MRWIGSISLVVLAMASPGTGATAQESRCEIDSLAPWAVVSRTWSREVNLRWSNDSLRRVLLDLAREDQEGRREFGARVTDSSYARRLIELDRRLSATVKGILDEFGLPTRSMVGPAGASAVLLVVQHSESLQARVLDLSRRVAPGELPPQSLAMLEDRVLVHEGKMQRFGSHFSLSSDGRFRFAPTEDLKGLEKRRSAVGIPPLDLYVCLLEEAGMRIDRTSLPPH